MSHRARYAAGILGLHVLWYMSLTASKILFLIVRNMLYHELAMLVVENNSGEISLQQRTLYFLSYTLPNESIEMSLQREVSNVWVDSISKRL